MLTEGPRQLQSHWHAPTKSTPVSEMATRSTAMASTTLATPPGSQIAVPVTVLVTRSTTIPLTAMSHGNDTFPPLKTASALNPTRIVEQLPKFLSRVVPDHPLQMTRRTVVQYVPHRDAVTAASSALAWRNPLPRQRPSIRHSPPRRSQNATMG